MNRINLLGAVFLGLGILALVHGGFSYTKDSTAVKLGPVELKVQEKQTVSVPIWAGIAAIVAGGLVLVGAGRK